MGQIVYFLINFLKIVLLSLFFALLHKDPTSLQKACLQKFDAFLMSLDVRIADCRISQKGSEIKTTYLYFLSFLHIAISREMSGFASETLNVFQRIVNPVRRGLFEINAQIFEILPIEVAIEVISTQHVPVLSIPLKVSIVH